MWVFIREPTGQRVDWQTPSYADVRLKRTDILMSCTNVD